MSEMLIGQTPLTPSRSGMKDVSAPLTHLRRSRGWARRVSLAIVLALLLIIVGAALLAPLVAPYNPTDIALDQGLRAPSARHWFGTDQLGRDVLSRVIWGARVSLLIALSAVVLAGAFGGLVGLVAGYAGGWIDIFVMRFADVQFSLPAVIMALVLVGTVGSSLLSLIVVLSLANWARFARVVRSEALALRNADFVLLARLAGASSTRIVIRHILPNVGNTFIVLATLDIGLIVILEATLSFLGLGVQPPDPSWGAMIADGRGYLERAWWASILPGAVLMTTVLCFNQLGDALRDGLNPRLKSRW